MKRLFFVIAIERTRVMLVSDRCHQFYPFGFNSDVTIANDGQGHCPSASARTMQFFQENI